MLCDDDFVVDYDDDGLFNEKLSLMEKNMLPEVSVAEVFFFF